MKRIKVNDQYKEVILDKDQADKIKSLNKVAYPNQGRSIQGIFTKGNIQFATDGYTVLAINSDNNLPECIQGNKVIDMDGRIALYKEYDNPNVPYPSVVPCFPSSEPAFQISVNPNFLINALEAMKSTRVTIIFYAKTKPIEIISKDGNTCAVVMPMYHDGEQVRPEWVKELHP